MTIFNSREISFLSSNDISIIAAKENAIYVRGHKLSIQSKKIAKFILSQFKCIIEESSQFCSSKLVINTQIKKHSRKNISLFFLEN